MSSSINSPVRVSNPTFTGTSKFASSLQQVLGRAVGIAALPLQSLAARMTTLNGTQSALAGLDSSFGSLQSTVTALARTVHSNILSSSVSDGGVVSASVGAGAVPGQYSLEVLSLGSYSTALSQPGQTVISDPAAQGLDGESVYNLTAGGATTTITTTASSLNALVSAINEQASGEVQATIVNAGTSGTPDYRLSLRAIKLGTDPISFGDMGNPDLISASSAGALASYKVNGLSATITSDTRNVALAPGLSVTLVGQSVADHAATITVSHNAAGLASALSSFAQAYNNATDALAQQRGESGGALQGHSLVWSLGGALRQLGTYTSGSPADSLAAFGITLNKGGHLSVDSSAFQSAANANFQGLLTILGDPATGGFLKLATDTLAAAEDPDSGSIKSETSALTTQITRQQNKIAIEQDRVARLQAHLTDQIAKADAAIALLESRVSYVSGLFAQFTGYNSNNQNNGQPTP